MPNSYTNGHCLRAMQGASLYHFYDGLWCDPAGTRTADLPHESVTTWSEWMLDVENRWTHQTTSHFIYRINLNYTTPTQTLTASWQLYVVSNLSLIDDIEYDIKAQLNWFIGGIGLWKVYFGGMYHVICEKWVHIIIYKIQLLENLLILKLLFCSIHLLSCIQK